MKKNLLIAVLVMAIFTSVVSGTLAVYTSQVDDIAAQTNQVVAKQFVLTGAGVDTFNDTVKIAPTETVNKSFTISNFEGAVVTETAMDVSLTVALQAADGTAIPNLEVVITKDGATVGTATTDASGNASITIDDSFALATEGQTYTYNVAITWPSSNSDNDYMNGAERLTVSVVGTQA